MLELLSLIYPGPAEAVEEARRSGTLAALHTYPGPDNPGVFALIDRPDFTVFFEIGCFADHTFFASSVS